jgi:hypothetical protein
MKHLKEYLANSIKGIAMFLVASGIFILLISILAFSESSATSEFPLQDVMYKHFQLFILLCIVSIPIGFVIGIINDNLSKKRIFWSSLTGLILYWLMIILVIMIKTGFSLSNKGFSETIKISLWAMLSYTMFAVPLIVIAAFLIGHHIRK